MITNISMAAATDDPRTEISHGLQINSDAQRQIRVREVAESPQMITTRA